MSHPSQESRPGPARSAARYRSRGNDRNTAVSRCKYPHHSLCHVSRPSLRTESPAPVRYATYFLPPLPAQWSAQCDPGSRQSQAPTGSASRWIPSWGPLVIRVARLTIATWWRCKGNRRRRPSLLGVPPASVSPHRGGIASLRTSALHNKGTHRPPIFNRLNKMLTHTARPKISGPAR